MEVAPSKGAVLARGDDTLSLYAHTARPAHHLTVHVLVIGRLRRVGHVFTDLRSKTFLLILNGKKLIVFAT